MTDPVAFSAFLDTSVVAAALIPATAHHVACADYCESLRRQRTIVLTSSVLRLEFTQVWFRVPKMPKADAELRREFRLVP